MKKIVILLVIIFLLIMVPGCSPTINEELICDFKYYYSFDSSPMILKDSDEIKMKYINDNPLDLIITIDSKYAINTKSFMNSYKPDIKFSEIRLKLFCNEYLIEEKMTNTIDEENKTEHGYSDLLYGYTLNVLSLFDEFSIDTPGNYKVEIYLEVFVDGKSSTFTDEIIFSYIF